MKNTFVKVLSFMMALTMIVGAFGAITVSAAEHDHVKSGDPIQVVAPTCQTPGFSRYLCECGEEFVADPILPSAEYHNIEEVEAIPASCLTQGYTAGRRCTVKGCDEVAEGCEPIDTAPQVPHVFVGKEYAPTCTTAGKVVYTCSLCGKTAKWLKDNNKLLAAQLAEYDTKWADKATDKDALSHNYVWTIEKAPVQNTTKPCEDGLSKGVCANCGDVKTVSIPVHNDSSWVLINGANLPCVEWNNQAKWCAKCHTIKPGDENKKQQTVGHNDTTKYEGKLDATDAAFVAYGLKLTDLYDLGLVPNQDLYVEPTCTTAGYQLVKCSCGELYVKPLAATNHTYGAWSAYTVPTLCTEASVKTRECSVCGYDDVSVYAAAANTEHAKHVVVTAAKCEAFGYTTTTCTNTFVINGVTYTCGYEGVDSYTDPIGHSYGAITYVSGGCANGVYQKTCTRPECKATDHKGNDPAAALVDRTVPVAIANVPAAQKAHTWGETKSVAATCAEKNYTYKQCTKCNYYFVSNTDTVGSATLVKHYPTDAKLDATNHEYVHVRWGSATPTCTTAKATEIVKCGNAACATLDTETTREVTNPVAHTVEIGYVTGSGSSKVFHAGGKAATCQATGFKADGKACSVCKTVISAPTVIPKDPAKHTDEPSDANKVGAYVGATCQAAGYQKYFLKCCGNITIANKDDPKKTTCSWVAGTEGNAIVAPTCTTNGSHKYQKCEWCNTIKPDSVVTEGCTGNGCTAASHEAAKFNNNPVIAKLGHNYKTNVARAPENAADAGKLNCEVNYIKAHKACDRDGCDYVLFNGVEYNRANATSEASFLAVARELAHYEAFKQTFTAKTATCTETGVDGSRAYCTVCEEDAWIIAKEPHNLNAGKTFTVNLTNTLHVIDCTKDSCIVKECKDCSYREATYTKAADANHNWSAWANDDFTGKFTCKDDKTQSRYCQDCAAGVTTETRLQTNGAATGCYTTKGVEGANATKYYIDYACDKISEFFGWSCDVCHCPAITKADAVHNEVTDSLAATCTSDGYTIHYCSGCGLTNVNTKVDFFQPVYDKVAPADGDYEHDLANGIVLETVAATATADGYTKYICADCNQTITKVLPKPAATLVQTYTVSTNKVAAGDKFTVTLKFSGKDMSYSKFDIIDVPYDASRLTLVGVTANADLAGLSAFAATKVESSVNYVGVALVIANDAEGNAQKVNTTAAGTVLFTLEFQANKTASGNATVAGKTVAIAGVGNLNGDAIVTAADAQAIFAQIGTNNAAADVNNDGIVNLADVAALATFAASGKTAKDYLVMAGEYAKIEAEVYALLDAGRLANHDAVTSVINVNDALALIAKIDAKLAYGYATLGDNVTAAAVVAYYNAYSNVQ